MSLSVSSRSSKEQQDTKTTKEDDPGRLMDDGNDPDNISREQGIDTLLTDESIADMKFQCSDGGIALANRAWLASRSTVFRNMLYGNFKEANDDVVETTFTSAIMKAVIEYIYNDHCSLFHDKLSRGSAREERAHLANK